MPRVLNETWAKLSNLLPGGWERISVNRTPPCSSSTYDSPPYHLVVMLLLAGTVTDVYLHDRLTVIALTPPDRTLY